MTGGKVGKWLVKKLSQKDIERLCSDEATSDSEKVLIVHSDDMSFENYFPNRQKANVSKKSDVDIIAKKYYEQIPVSDSSFDAIICTGLLEHVPEPEKTLKEFHRILKPDGKVVISASFAFSNHNAPENYFHFTVDGLKYLLEKTGFKVKYVRPSAKPFRTLAILFQRICYQTDMSPFLKAPLFLVAKVLPFFDRFIKKDHGGIKRDYPIESSLYSNTQGVGRKSE